MSKFDAVREEAKFTWCHRLKLKDLGLKKWFLSINITHKQDQIHMKQQSYVEKLVDLFNIGEAKHKFVPLIVGESLNSLSGRNDTDDGKKGKMEFPYSIYRAGGVLVLPRSLYTAKYLKRSGTVGSSFSFPASSHLKALKNFLEDVKGQRHMGCSIVRKLMVTSCAYLPRLHGLMTSDEKVVHWDSNLHLRTIRGLILQSTVYCVAQHRRSGINSCRYGTQDGGMMQIMYG